MYPATKITSAEVNATGNAIFTVVKVLAVCVIGTVILTQAQFDEVATVRAKFKAWPKEKDWPLIEIPAIPQWILIEAANNGFVVLTWPPVEETEVNEPAEPEPDPE